MTLTRRSDASLNINDDWVRLRPGPKRIDELTDFIEWMPTPSRRMWLRYEPTEDKRGGVYTVIEPVAVVPVADNEGLRSAFRDTIARKNIDVPPVKGKLPLPILSKYAHVKSWSALDRGTSTWNIHEDDESYKSSVIGSILMGIE